MPVEGGNVRLVIRGRLETKHGLPVADVAAADEGFRPGDVIQEVNRRPVTDVDGLRAAVKASGQRPALVVVTRKGESLFLTLEPPRPER